MITQLVNQFPEMLEFFFELRIWLLFAKVRTGYIKPCLHVRASVTFQPIPESFGSQAIVSVVPNNDLSFFAIELADWTCFDPEFQLMASISSISQINISYEIKEWFQIFDRLAFYSSTNGVFSDPVKINKSLFPKQIIE